MPVSCPGGRHGWPRPSPVSTSGCPGDSKDRGIGRAGLALPDIRVGIRIYGYTDVRRCGCQDLSMSIRLARSGWRRRGPGCWRRAKPGGWRGCWGCWPIRSRILFALSAAGELCVGDLALALEATEDQVSYALKMLRLAGMVSFRKDGRMMFYRLSDGFPHPLLEHCLRQLLSIASPEGHDASA